MCKSKCNTEKPYLLIIGGEIDFKICSVNKLRLFLGLQNDVYGHNGHFCGEFKEKHTFQTFN